MNIWKKWCTKSSVKVVVDTSENTILAYRIGPTNCLGTLFIIEWWCHRAFSMVGFLRYVDITSMLKTQAILNILFAYCFQCFNLVKLSIFWFNSKVVWECFCKFLTSSSLYPNNLVRLQAHSLHCTLVKWPIPRLWRSLILGYYFIWKTSSEVLGIIVQPELPSICNSRCPWGFLFLFQFCDVTKVVIIHKTI
jgi:hypothetical protein